MKKKIQESGQKKVPGKADRRRVRDADRKILYSLWVQYPDPWVGFEKLLKYAILQA